MVSHAEVMKRRQYPRSKIRIVRDVEIGRYNDASMGLEESWRRAGVRCVENSMEFADGTGARIVRRRGRGTSSGVGSGNSSSAFRLGGEEAGETLKELVGGAAGVEGGSCGLKGWRLFDGVWST